MTFPDEHGRRVLKNEMNVLAAEVAVDGAVMLRPHRRNIAYIQKLPGTAAGLEAQVNWEPLRRLAESARTFQVCAGTAAKEGGTWVSGCGNHARIVMIAERLVARGDRPVDAASMQYALREFDDVQGLTMAEYYAFPEAVRIAVCEACADAAGKIISAAEEYEAARKWVESGGTAGDILRRPPAFFEHALQLAMEEEKPEVRLRLENALSRLDTSGEACVRLCREQSALAVMRLNNLLSTVRAVEAANWQKVFEGASRTEAELRRDPDGTYPRMSDASRAAVRERLALIARRLHAGETTVARYAVNAAREMPAGDVRRSICWWIYDDEGTVELARRLGGKRYIPRVFPDPKGYVYMTLQTAASVLVALFAACLSGSFLWAALFLPLAWRLVSYAIARIVTRVMKPRTVLRLKYDKLPGTARTLVAVTALLASPERAREMCRRLETLGCLEKDENIEFVLVGDFADSKTRVRDTDMAILAAAREETERMNAAAGRIKYHFLHRERTYAEKDGIYRGHERKRGALMALCRLATGRRCGEFAAEGTAEEAIYGRFRYLVALDADTRMLPGTAAELVGTIAHPLNRACFLKDRRRGYAVMQPLAELDAEECKNEFVRLFAGEGGLNTYSGMVSDLFHDIAGMGSYCGKAVIDMPAFVDQLEGRLDGGRILSHDFIEGLISGAGHINDISFFDGFPEAYGKWLRRTERWIRGDWQLLPELLRGGISALGRFTLVSNLLDSLRDIALMLLFVIALWAGNAPAFALGIGFGIMVPIIRRILGDRQAFVRGSFELAVLPASAYVRADAICRALWRTFVSGRKLLEWVTSADDPGGENTVKVACRCGAMLLLPGLFGSYWIAPALALAALFLSGPGLAREFAKEDTERIVSDNDMRNILLPLARDTWRFFERYVTRGDNFLPPDNVQLEADVGIARRTSPTNIGMYMLSCVCARELGFIGDDEMRLRLSDTLNTLDKMEKWHGNIYNWYDTATLAPLKPRYVSSVDSGNLAAALLLCANACGDEALSVRLRGFAERMDLGLLYDEERDLFFIGFDAENNRPGNSHYDLLASESRILSYMAIMLGQVPVKHWRRLGRPVSGDTLMSWSGTMFEYFMPALIMPSAKETLLGRTYRGVIKAQKAFADARSRPWGISESGYHAFDRDMNYQYRAFGLNALSMSGTRAQDVVAPYGACLGLMAEPAEALLNIGYIMEKGWRGECGMYEAVDFVRREPRPVRSWMSHHQGMALCAMCNVLTDNCLQRYFMDIPEAGALRLLLNERAVSRIKLKPVKAAEVQPQPRRSTEGTRRGRSGSVLMDTALIGGADACAVVSARGDIIYSRRGIYAARFTGDTLRRRDGMFTFVTDERGGQRRIDSADSECVFGVGEAFFRTHLSGADISMRLAVSPEDGMLVKYIEMENKTGGALKLTLVDGLETALMDVGELRAHPAFHRLFCRTELYGNNAVLTRRKSRDGSGDMPVLVHAAACDVCGRETDWLRLMGREGVLNADFKGRNGAQTDPCSALKTEFMLQCGEKITTAFAVGLCDAGVAGRMAERYGDAAAAERACELAGSFVRSAAEFAGLDDEGRVLAERACAAMSDPKLMHRSEAAPPVQAAGDHCDLPRMCVTVDRKSGLDVLREAVRMHEYCRGLGFVYQLALIYDHDGGYEQPLRDGIYDIISASHLRDMCYARGGITVYDARSMQEERRTALLRGSALCVDGTDSFRAQLRRCLSILRHAGKAEYVPMPCGDTGANEETTMRYGSWEDEGFIVDVRPGNVPPAPWSNIITADKLGMLVTERGGGFIWHGNSRLRRITNFDNDPANEGWSTMFYVTDRQGRQLRALPCRKPDREYRVCHALSESTYRCAAEGLNVETAIFADEDRDEIIFRIELENTGDIRQEYTVAGFVDWLVGADGTDAPYTREWNGGGALFASGVLDTVAYFACDVPGAEADPGRNEFLGNGGVSEPDGLGIAGSGGCALAVHQAVLPGKKEAVSFVLGCAAGLNAAGERAASVVGSDTAAMREKARQKADDRNDKLRICTGDRQLDRFVNGFLLKQVLAGRVKARAGFYQAGGAFGFRDQLQDMLALLPYEPETVRSHILECARHQFIDGDVMHWWHPPMTGVRTHISDDMLFLPFVTCRYVIHTGDYAILNERIPYLKNIEIPAGREDVYAEMEVSSEEGTLKDHCMRAFRRACRRGSHGLLLMGSGDWNDGMNRVGELGRGESVWLTMFFAACAAMFAGLLADGMDRAWLEKNAEELKKNTEKHSWDGEWYLRAYDDDGKVLGSADNSECAIDLISQAWSAMSGLDGERAKTALDSAWEKLFAPECGIMKLLTPAFEGRETDPGYIAAYPPGVRENGGQYTHAACWYLIALAKTGDAARAKRLLNALMPYSHAADNASADRYRTEPYVMAADIYGEPPFEGRGGWTWYTGAAGWLLCAVRYLLGYERRGNMVRLNALEGIWERPRAEVRYGSSVYTLISDSKVQKLIMDGAESEDDFVVLVDDCADHECIFPARRGFAVNSQ